MSGCPVRKLEPEPRRSDPAVERVDDAEGTRWVVRSFPAARALLRRPDGTRQAGFGGDRITAASIRRPILYLEGAEHRSQRKAAARLFAPVVVEGYRPMIEQLSRDLVVRVGRRPVDLSELAMRMAVEVAAQVVGLTSSSRRGLSRRLNTFFAHDPLAAGTGRRLDPRALLRLAQTSTATARFFTFDVKPAIRARRRSPREDVISQLIAAGFTDAEILTECLTYGAAGMVTTREFLTMAAWHLLDEPDLLARYRAADRDERVLLLQETLRLEPVVGHLRRRTEQPVDLPTPDGDVRLEPGTLVDLDLRAVNADAGTVGAEPYGLCPGRELPGGVPPAVLSFGDGHHRCPGGPLAMMESEIFLSALLERDVVSLGPPRVRWNPTSAGYDLDRFFVRLAG